MASVGLGVFRIRPRKPDPIKEAVYECGMVPVGDALVRYNVRYYLFALLFVVFDVEAIFLYPWAVAYRALGVYAFVEASLHRHPVRRLRLCLAQGRHGVDLVPHAATVSLPATEVAGVSSRLPGAVRGVEPGWVVSEPARVRRDGVRARRRTAGRQVSRAALQRRPCDAHRGGLSPRVAGAEPHVRTQGARDHEEPSVASVVPLWVGATLQEREAYDLMGVRFPGHPDLTRLFLWDAFPGHPLRKDFMALPGGQKAGLSQFPKQVSGETGGEFRPRLPGTGE